MKLTDFEVIQLRIKCAEPFISTGSKLGIEKEKVIELAEILWKFAIKPLTEHAHTTEPQKK